MDELERMDATAQAALVASKDLSPEELCQAAIARIERVNPELNAVIHPLFDKAQSAASAPSLDGPFRGVPIVVKDLGALTQGDPFHAGMRLAQSRNFTAPVDSFLVTKLRQAGFVICGKTNTPELGILPTTEPLAYGPTKNPYDPTRSPGGSSGGSAAAVASGMVAVAHGNDGGGSIRIPASCCGLVGLKPTRGRVSMGPAVGDVNGGLTAEGALTRSVRDTAALLDVMAGPMPGDPYYAPPPKRPFRDEVGADPGHLRVAYCTEYITAQGTVAKAHPDCIAAVEHAARLLEGLGHQVTCERIDALVDPNYLPRFLSIWFTGVAAGLAGWGEVFGAPLTQADVEPTTWALGEMGKHITSATYLRNWSWLQACNRRVASFFLKRDIWLTPTLAEPPAPLGTFVPTDDNPLAAIYRAASYAPFTPPINATGQPAISLPLYRNAEGLPIGVQLVGAYAREDLLIRLASQIEEASPFVHHATI